ncbi:hypothetical protein [Burkholderia sp. 567]|uniref:hypothetical protein n=1 Tax=Burkholderia sp. 567 TaxID=3156413 RepID=UPI0033931250
MTIFPPRANVEPGDLYIVCSNPTNPGKPSDRFPPIFVTPLDGFHDRIADFFKQRWNLPSEKSTSARQSIDIPEVATGINTPKKWTRLALVSFPEIFQVVGSTISAGAAAPTGFSVFGLGGQKKKLETYVLSMPAAEWAGLPWIQAQDQANIALDNLGPANRRKIVTLYQGIARKYTTACGAVRLAVVQEVYYTRHMSLSFGTDKAAAINAQARLYVNPNQARFNVQQAASQTAVANPPAAASTSSDAHVNEANKHLSDAQTAANAAVNLGLPGAVFTSASVGDDGLSFNYYFAAPIAVGAKLLDVSIGESETDGDTAASPAPGPETSSPHAGSTSTKKAPQNKSAGPSQSTSTQSRLGQPKLSIRGDIPPVSDPTTPLSDQYTLDDQMKLPASSGQATQGNGMRKPAE